MPHIRGCPIPLQWVTPPSPAYTPHLRFLFGTPHSYYYAWGARYTIGKYGKEGALSQSVFTLTTQVEIGNLGNVGKAKLGFLHHNPIGGVSGKGGYLAAEEGCKDGYSGQHFGSQWAMWVQFPTTHGGYIYPPLMLLPGGGFGVL
jgi:hypothetical protein